jgi:hypothetical protein
VATGTLLDVANESNLQLLINPNSSEFWALVEADGAWICLDFGDHKVSFMQYFLKSAPMPTSGKHLKSGSLKPPSSPPVDA